MEASRLQIVLFKKEISLIVSLSPKHPGSWHTPPWVPEHPGAGRGTPLHTLQALRSLPLHHKVPQPHASPGMGAAKKHLHLCRILLTFGPCSPNCAIQKMKSSPDSSPWAGGSSWAVLGLCWLLALATQIVFATEGRTEWGQRSSLCTRTGYSRSQVIRDFWLCKGTSPTKPFFFLSVPYRPSP